MVKQLVESIGEYISFAYPTALFSISFKLIFMSPENGSNSVECQFRVSHFERYTTDIVLLSGGGVKGLF